MKYLALLLPCFLALCAPLYNRLAPDLFGMPFFFWYQLALVPISAIGIFVFDRARKS